jgi:hypothetical protein
MFKRLAVLCVMVMFVGTAEAMAASYNYEIDQGTPAVISSASKMARIVLIASGDCTQVPYNIIADGVSSLRGKLDLSHEVSFPLDLSVVTLSCSQKGIRARVFKHESSILGDD